MKTTSSVGSVPSSEGQFTRKCSCFRTQCLKMYCECFSAKRKCDGCACVSCMNHDESIEAIEVRAKAIQEISLRNPNAFSAKIQKNPINAVPVHSRGCNCRRSNCLKNYCECFEARVKCNTLCRCQNCFNCDSHDQPERKDSILESSRKEKRTNVKSREDTLKKKTGLPHSAKSMINSPVAKVEDLVVHEETLRLKTFQNNQPSENILSNFKLNTPFFSELTRLNFPLAALLMYQTQQMNSQETSRNSSSSSTMNQSEVQFDYISNTRSQPRSNQKHAQQRNSVQNFDFLNDSQELLLPMAETSTNSSKRKQNRPYRISDLTDTKSARDENCLDLSLNGRMAESAKDIQPEDSNLIHTNCQEILLENQRLRQTVRSLRSTLRRKIFLDRAISYHRKNRNSFQV